MDKRYLWLLFIAVIVFLIMVAGINMFVRSAQNIQPLNSGAVAARSVLNEAEAEDRSTQKMPQEEPVYEQQLPKGEVLLN